METKKKQFNKIELEMKALIDQINILANDKSVKKYFELLGQKEKLANHQRDLYYQIKFEEYSSCDHIWVNTLHDYDSYEGRSYNYCGCIKCGLDQRVFRLMEIYSDLGSLTFEQRIMYDFMEGRTYTDGIDTKVLCDLELAKAIYSKIKEGNPYIDDETAGKYFEIALDNIRKIKVSDDRKANRAKRLSLSPKFNKWNEWDVSRR